MSVIRKLVPKADRRPFCTAVLVAAGSSQRMGEDKLFMELCGQTVLTRSIAVFERSEYIDEILIVSRSEKITEIADLCRENGFHKVKKIICGGDTRMKSALAGVSEMNRRTEIAAIHDAARPLVTEEIIQEVVLSAAKNLAATPAIPLKDTIKEREGEVVTGTPERSRLVAVQTPQAFHAELISGALTRAVSGQMQMTDDCSAVEAMGVKVWLTHGSEENIKLTTPIDFEVAAAILKARGEAF